MEKDIEYIEIVRPDGFRREQIEEAMAESADGVEGGKKVLKKSIIRLAMVTVTRLKAYDRGEAQDQVLAWVRSQLGIEENDDLDFTQMPTKDFYRFQALWTACDIVGALVPEACENFPEMPDDVFGWPDAKDFIFDPALAAARRLNPHWAVEARGQQQGN